MFFCDMEEINVLAGILNMVNVGAIETGIPVQLRCQLLFNEDVQACQSVAPEGSISFHLDLEKFPGVSEEDYPEEQMQKDKAYFVEVLIEGFQDYLDLKDSVQSEN